MSTGRDILENYVRQGKLMQLATLREDSSPAICNVWYDPHFSPDLLRFISRYDRAHSKDIRRSESVAGSIVAMPLEALGQKVQGVTFRGLAKELPTVRIASELADFLARWPLARAAIDPDRLARGETESRLYEVLITEWVLFDEIHFPDNPRRLLPADRGPVGK